MQEKTKLNKNALLKTFFAALMLVTGALLSVLFEGVSSPFGTLARSLGISFIVAGTVALFQGIPLIWMQESDVQDGFESVLRLLEKPGIRVVQPHRQGYAGYYKWILEKEPQELFFAGHSVLHRVQADFSERRLIPVEDALKQQLVGSSKIRILFLDPTWDFLDDIANAEKQSPLALRRHIATTLGICHRFWKNIKDEKLAGEIEIRTCNELVQYAFHHVACKEKNEDEILVGFYFAGTLGARSPVLLIENDEIRDLFASHFRVIFERARPLLVCTNDGMKEFDDEYYQECRETLTKKLGRELVARLCPED